MLRSKLTGLLIFILFGQALLRAQKTTPQQNRDNRKQLENAIKEVKKNGDLAPIEVLLGKEAFSNPIWQSNLYAAEAHALANFHREKFKNMDASAGVADPDALRVLAIFEKGIAACARCSLKIMRRRYHFLKQIKAPLAQRDADLIPLKAAGFKEDAERTGVGLGLHAFAQQGGFWLGADFSLITKFHPGYRMRWFDPEKGKKVVVSNEVGGSLSGLTFSFARRLDENLSEFSGTIFRVSAPVVLDVTRFGWYFSPNPDLNRKAFYRPEFGIGRGRFSLSYGYNLVFSRPARAALPKHLFFLRFHTPLFSERGSEEH